MKHQKKILAGTVVLGVLSLAISAFEFNNAQLQKDVETKVADLHRVYSQFMADRRDVAAAQENLKSPALTLDQRQSFRTRVEKDMEAILAENSAILGDLSYLQNNWGALTQEQKDFVNQVTKGLQT